VDRQVWTPRNGAAVFAPPKSDRSNGTVALSDTVLAALSEHVKAYGPGRDGLVFHNAGEFFTREVLGSRMRASVARAGLPGVTWHDLRHHHASILLSGGVTRPSSLSA
jgi:integrase